MKGETMTMNLVRAKTYHLAGDGLRIEFCMEDPKELELVYEDQKGERKFSGKAIYQKELQLGFVPSVVLEQVPDLHTVFFSLIVPSASRSNNQKSISLRTFAIRTTSRTSIDGPEAVEGQVQTHEIFTLEGNAW
jgi:hypothetical protein